MSVLPSRLRAHAVQIVAQNDGGGDVVERRSPIGSLALFATAMRRRSSFIRHDGLFGLPRAQPLIHHFDRNTQRFFDTRGEALRFLRHSALRAIQAQRQSDNDEAHRVLAN